VTDEPNPAGDPWLTLAEIASELRVTPATVRLWISRGRLSAKRAGQRKLLVQRSELDRMLAATQARDADPSPAPGPRRVHPFAPPRPARVRSWSASSVARAKVPPEVRQEALKNLQAASTTWDAALDASENAPPDPGFVNRLRAIADAADVQYEALSRAERIPGFLWKPVADAENMILSTELRPEANRPGPGLLWTHFDHVVERLALAMEGSFADLVHLEYMELGIVLRDIIRALESDHGSDEAPAAD
jgi:excisionase family DNA binding protein